MEKLLLNRPLVAAVAAYGVGLLLAEVLHVPLGRLVWILAMASVLIGSFLFLAKGPSGRRYLIWLLLAFAGWGNLAWRTENISPTDLRIVIGTEPVLVTLRGTLAETPKLKVTEHDGEEKWRSAARVRIRELQKSGAGDFQPVVGDILVTTPEVLNPDFFMGQPVEISGVMALPPVPVAEGLFNFRNYLETRGIFYQVKTDSTNDWKLLEPRLAKPPWTDRFLTWARGTLALGLPQEDEPLRLLWAMTLGWKTAFTGDIDEPFLRAGTMHMFAVDEATELLTN